MTKIGIEKRLEILEAEVAALKSQASVNGEIEVPWWKQRIGTFANNPAYDEAMQLGREYLDSQIFLMKDKCPR